MKKMGMKLIQEIELENVRDPRINKVKWLYYRQCINYITLFRFYWLSFWYCCCCCCCCVLLCFYRTRWSMFLVIDMAYRAISSTIRCHSSCWLSLLYWNPKNESIVTWFCCFYHCRRSKTNWIFVKKT